MLAEALNQNLGHVALEPLQHALIQEQVTDCVALTPGQHGLLAEYATREGLRQELAAIAVVNQGRRACAPLGDQRFQADERVSADQRNAVRALLESTDRVCALRGVAGAGKTFALKEVQRGLTAAGREIFACAPTTSAAEVLRGEGFSGAITLADLLKNGETVHGARLRGATLIVDEAGITSTRQGAELCALVQRQDARLLLVGDSHQHSGVEAGDFLALLEKHSHLRTAELTDIRRQSVRAYRGAVKLMAQGQARAGLSALDQLGWIEEGGATYVRRAADHYVDRLAAQRDVILVAPTWAEIHRLTDAVRTGLKQRGLLGESQSVAVAEPLGWTRAQAERVTNYRPGFWLTLHRPLREAGLPAGETVEVIGVGRGALRIRDGQGREVNVSPRGDATSWTAAAPRVIELASGDRVLIRQNQRTAGLVNGEVLTLGVRKSDGAWSARDAAGQEKIIPADFRALAHGYAVTSHKSQGRTCDEVIVCAARLDAKAAYVAFSRARQRATGYTPDKAALFDALPASNRPRVAALDLWTPARSRRLRWVRQVVERVREMLAPILRLPELVAPPAMPMPAPVLKPRQAMGPSSRASQSRHAERAAPTMRVRF